ncbi:MAG: efflux RND transporter periplasmic adaptor subunit, partial [Bacteroides sp.]
MKKIHLLCAFSCALLLASCGNKASQEEHNHGEEGHNHEAEVKNEHSDEIIFPPAKAQAETIQTKEFRQVIKTGGQVLAAQGDETTVVANVAGIVSFKSPVTDGMIVRQGAALVVLSSKDMIDGNPAQRAKITYDIARQDYERAKGLLSSKIVSEKDFNITKQNYENARISYEAVAKHQTAGGQIVTAPMSGYIKNCLVNEGDYVQIGQPLVSITQNRKLFLRADVSEKYYSYLSTISSANFKTAYDNRVYQLEELGGRVLSYGKASGTSSYYIPV